MSPRYYLPENVVRRIYDSKEWRKYCRGTNLGRKPKHKDHRG